MESRYNKKTADLNKNIKARYSNMWNSTINALYYIIDDTTVQSDSDRCYDNKYITQCLDINGNIHTHYKTTDNYFLFNKDKNSLTVYSKK